jgi:hypothetical protein
LSIGVAIKNVWDAVTGSNPTTIHTDSTLKIEGFLFVDSIGWVFRLLLYHLGLGVSIGKIPKKKKKIPPTHPLDRPHPNP